MSDLISRRAAYEALTAYYHHTTDMQHAALYDALNRVPSAQPEKSTEKRTETHACDLISRQAVIDAVEKYDFNFPEYMERFVTELRDAMKEDLKGDIADLPSAQPKIIKCKDCKNSPLKTWFSCPLSHLPFDGERWCWKGET